MSSVALAAVVLSGLAACQPVPDEFDPDATPTGTKVVDVTIPSSLHAQGIAVPAKLVRPTWASPVGKRPAMLVLHGSGGLMKMPSSSSTATCSSQMESQYASWGNRLAMLGYTVLLPSSYSARGFCDKHDDADRMPRTFDEDPEQIIGRIYDTDAASRYLCARVEVECARMGVMGFSQGGTMTLLALHWQTNRALNHWREIKADDYDISVPNLKAGAPTFRTGIAFYPGCGFDGAVPLSTGSGPDIEDKYTPTAPLTILHGTKDSLIKECSTQYASGRRQTQSREVAGALEVPDRYSIIVYVGASHGFDSSKSGSSTDSIDDRASVDALKVTLNRLATQL